MSGVEQTILQIAQRVDNDNLVTQSPESRDLLFASQIIILCLERIIQVLPGKLGMDRNSLEWQNAENKMRFRLFEND